MLANTKKWRANSWWLGPISQHLANEEHFHWKTHSSDRLLRHYYHTCPGDVPSTMHMAGACLKMHLSNQFHCPVLQHHLQKPQLIHRAKCSNQDHQLLPFLCMVFNEAKTSSFITHASCWHQIMMYLRLADRPKQQFDFTFKKSPLIQSIIVFVEAPNSDMNVLTPPKKEVSVQYKHKSWWICWSSYQLS